MSVLAELSAYIAANVSGLSYALVLGTTLFAGRRMPDKPDACVALIEYAGRPPIYTHTSGGVPAWEYPRVQVTCRDINGAGGYANARGNAEKLYQQIGLTNTVINGTFYLNVRQLQTPFEMGPDAKDRPIYGFNVECQKYLSAA